MGTLWFLLVFSPHPPPPTDIFFNISFFFSFLAFSIVIINIIMFHAPPSSSFPQILYHTGPSFFAFFKILVFMVTMILGIWVLLLWQSYIRQEYWMGNSFSP